METVADFILGGSKITADGNCSHEIKRCLLLGRKVMTNLDSIFKSRDISLPTKVCLVKAMIFFPVGGSDGKASCLQCGRPGFDPWVGKIHWRRKWQPTPVFLPGKSHGERSLAGYSPLGHKESDTTKWLHFNDQPRQHIKKQRHFFANKGLSSQSYGFSSSHVWMWVGL